MLHSKLSFVLTLHVWCVSTCVHPVYTLVGPEEYIWYFPLMLSTLGFEADSLNLEFAVLARPPGHQTPEFCQSLAPPPPGLELHAQLLHRSWRFEP